MPANLVRYFEIIIFFFSNDYNIVSYSVVCFNVRQVL